MFNLILNAAFKLYNVIGSNRRSAKPAFALTWHEPDSTEFTHQTPMVRPSEPTVTNYGADHEFAGIGSVATDLLAIQPGRRSLILSWSHTWLYRHPDDRCQDGTTLSSQPTFNGAFFKGGTGGDALPNGWSSIWHDGFIASAQLWSNALADAIYQAGATVDYIILDHESKMDEFKVSGSWRTALKADPRWPDTLNTLTTLKRARLNDSEAIWDDTEFFFYDGQENDWNAYMWSQQSQALQEGIIEVFRGYWPHIKASNYEHHGRKVDDAIYDINGHPYYQLRVTDTHASDYAYGWMSQLADKNLDGLGLYGEYSFSVFRWEQKKARAQLRAGYPIQPWIGFSGFDDSDWETDALAPTTHTANKYWKENIIHLILLGADPILYWNSRTYKAGNYSTDAEDQKVEDLLDEVNTIIGTQGPRNTVTTSKISWGEQWDEGDAGDTNPIPIGGSSYIATAMRYGTNVTYRVTIQRIPEDPAEWAEVDLNVIINGEDTGDTITIGEGEVGEYYTKEFIQGENITFGYVHPTLTNLLPNSPLFDENWTIGTGSLTPSMPDPNGGNDAIRLSGAGGSGDVLIYDPITVTPNTTYTFSVYGVRWNTGSAGRSLRIYAADGTTLLKNQNFTFNVDYWRRMRVTFTTDGVTTSIRPAIYFYRADYYGPMLNEGNRPSPF